MPGATDSAEGNVGAAVGLRVVGCGVVLRLLRLMMLRD